MFRPYTKEDKLEVGTKIRLGGREGEIISKDDFGDHWQSLISWKDGDGIDVWFNLSLFTSLEIEDIPLPPLKIDKRVKEELIRIVSKLPMKLPNPHHEDALVDLWIYLNSLEEV